MKNGTTAMKPIVDGHTPQNHKENLSFIILVSAFCTSPPPPYPGAFLMCILSRDRASSQELVAEVADDRVVVAAASATRQSAHAATTVA